MLPPVVVLSHCDEDIDDELRYEDDDEYDNDELDFEDDEAADYDNDDDIVLLAS